MELPVPVLQPAEMLVRVSYAGVNPFDAKIADGIFEGRRPHVFPLILGIDASGTVEAVGPGVQRFRTGDFVAGQFLHDPVGRGTYAELAPVPETIGVVRMPPSFSPEQAAALPTAGMTALDALETLNLPSESTLLVVGASGGVGSFATELASVRGVRVTAIARESSGARMRRLGATEVVDPGAPDLDNQLRGSHPTGFDGLLDLMSDRDGFARWRHWVRRGGSAATTTFSADPEEALRDGVHAVNINLQPTAPLLQRLVDQLAEHRLEVPVERTVSLEEAPAALADLRAGHGRGKTVVRVRP
jgi:NADPH:quinone reductase-like Zn-dependent oxidoreductase